MATAPSPSRVTPTGLGPRLKPGFIDKKVTPVRAKGGPRTPRATPMPYFGPRQNSRKGLRETILPKVRKSRTGGARRVGGKGR